MSVFKGEGGRGWRFQFDYKKVRHQSTHGYETKQDARDAEDAERRKVVAIAEGREIDPSQCPTFTQWAGVYLTWAEQTGRIQPHGTVEENIRMVLRFFGHAPATPDPINRHDRRAFKDLRPYHGLTLHDVVKDASWIVKFEQHMTARGISGPTKNKQRSALSQMYRYAMSPEQRHVTGITRNPFAEIYRDKGRKRYTTFGGDANLRAVLDGAHHHLRLAMRIAMYCPKFRLGNITSLDWSKGPTSTAWVSDDLRYLVDTNHKTFHVTGLPMVAVIPNELKRILLAAKKQQAVTRARLIARYKKTGHGSGHGVTCPRVIQWENKPIDRLSRGLKTACERAGVPYGMHGGVTFHSIKHDAGTEMAAMNQLSDAMRQQLLGQTTNQATQVYKQLVPEHERPAADQLAKVTRRKLQKQRSELRSDFSGKEGRGGAFTVIRGMTVGSDIPL